jgi:hypothetical protein
VVVRHELRGHLTGWWRPAPGHIAVNSHFSRRIGLELALAAVGGSVSAARTDMAARRHRHRAGHQPCHPRDKNIVVAGAGRRHAHQQAGGGDDAVIGAQHGGAQPANAIGTVAFGVSAGHGIPPAKR